VFVWIRKTVIFNGFLVYNLSMIRKNFQLPLLFFIAVTVIFFSRDNEALLAQNTAEPAQFLRNLRLGDSGSDVKVLQKRLNSNNQTIIALSGAGSPGNETDFFGLLTQKAVEKFQNLHKDKIFATAGIRSATGFVGPATRRVLEAQNTQSESTPKSLTLPPPSSADGRAVFSSPASLLSPSLSFSGTARLTSSTKQTVFVFRVVPAQVTPRGTITLTGEGFDEKNNTVFIGERVITNIPSADGNTLTLALPEALPLQTHNIWVENTDGTSKKAPAVVSLLVTNTPSDPPKITGTNPFTVSINDDVVVLVGSGFAPTGNNIYSSIGPIMNLPSVDGKSISLKLSSLSNLEQLKNPNMRGITISLWISIQNEYGIQIEPFPLVVTL